MIRTPNNDFKTLFFLLLGFYYELRDFSWSSIAAMEGLEFHFRIEDVERVFEATAKVKQQGGNGGACKVFGWLLGNFMEVLEKYVRWFRIEAFGQGGGDFLEEGATGNTNIKLRLHKIADGHFTAAVKVLSSSGVAPYYSDTIKALEAKDGLRAQHILDTLYGEGSTTAAGLLKVITLVVNLWLAGRCPPILAEFVASAPLTSLFKPDNEILPIVVGTIWRSLVFKVTMKCVGKEMSKYLSDFQFRVKVSSGAEASLHRVNRVLSENHNDGSLAMLNVDFSNAFNLVDRSALLHEVRVKCHSISLWVDFLYGHASRLYIGETHIWCATGVQQGDPFRPLLFALILYPLLHKIKDSCKLLLQAWYLDDRSVIRDSEEVARVLYIIKVSGPGLGLELNIKKTEIFCPSCNGVKFRDGLFPVDIQRPSSGVKLLGGAVSRDANFISGLAMRRVTNVVDLMGLLPRTYQPVHMEEAALFFDKGLCGSIENIVHQRWTDNEDESVKGNVYRVIPTRVPRQELPSVLPIIAKKVHQEKVQEEKLKAVKARLNFKETSQHFESGTPNRKRDLKKGLGSRHSRSMSESLEPMRGHSESPRKRDSERKTVFKRLEKGVFHRLKDKGKKFASERNHNKIASLRRTKALSESEGSAGGHWKSRPKRQMSSVKDDLSQPCYDDLKEAFLENFPQQKKCIKDSVKFTISSREMGTPRKNSCGDRAVIGRTEVELQEGKISKPTNAGTKARQIHSPHKDTKRDPGFRQRKVLASFANDNPGRKRNASKFCEFHREVGHTTDECINIKRQIKEMLKAGKLSRLIKELKQSSGKDQAKAVIKGETSGKDKPLAILMVKENQEKDKIGSKPDKNGKRGEAGKSQK
nr:putative reverse transcriptase domain-containing protein [Tanacetum cinerariifolium]